MNREGFSNSKISRELVIDRRTVKFYLSMDDIQPVERAKQVAAVGFGHMKVNQRGFDAFTAQ